MVNQEIQKFCKKHPQDYKFVKNLGQRNYFSCLKYFDLMVGNSSSGLIEAPSFKLPVVNIGDRQKGRLQAANVINSGDSAEQIRKSIGKAMSAGFKRSLKQLKSPYDTKKDGRISTRMKEVLRTLKITEGFVKKEFYQKGP